MVNAIYSDNVLRVAFYEYCCPLWHSIFYHQSVVLMTPPILSCLLCAFIYVYRGGVFGQQMSNVSSVIERLNVLLLLFVFRYLRLRRGIGIIREIVNLLYIVFLLIPHNTVLYSAIFVKANNLTFIAFKHFTKTILILPKLIT